MSKIGKRMFFGRGKGYLTAAGPQARFIIFLILLLVGYTLLLKVFQKLAQIVELPVFLPISLITLLIFIGIVGTLYSHKFVGPIVRIRRAIDQLAEGDTTVCLRLRETDDPILKDLVRAIGRLCEHTRVTHLVIQEAAGDVHRDIEQLSNMISRKAGDNELRGQLDIVKQQLDRLDKAIKSYRKH